jgi:HD superfamily phosphohydrolase
MTVVNTSEGERLGITHKGVGVTEHYLMARRLLTRNICHLQKKLAIEDLLVLLLANLSQGLETHPSFQHIANTRLAEFLISANRFNEQVEANTADELATAFLQENYTNYKSLCDYDVYALISVLTSMQESTPATDIASRIQHRVMPSTYFLKNEILETAINELKAFKHANKHKYQDWQLRIIRSPHQSYSGEDDPIYVVNEQGTVSPLSDYSIMINAMSDLLEHSAFLSIDKVIADDKEITQFVSHLVGSPKVAVMA